MLKILQARLQQYVNHELSDVQAGFRKGRGTRDQIANICWIIQKEREFQKNIYFYFTDYAKAFDYVAAAAAAPFYNHIMFEPSKWCSDLLFSFADHFPGFLTHELVPWPFYKNVSNY